MRILIDECVHVGVKRAFAGHEVQTVTEIGWRSSKDGPLLEFAQTAFDVFVTIDRSIQYQNNIHSLNLGIVRVRVKSNRIESYEPLFDDLKAAAEAVRPGGVIVVEAT